MWFQDLVTLGSISQPPPKKIFSCIAGTRLTGKPSPGFILTHSWLTRREATKDLVMLRCQGARQGIGIDQWGSYQPPFNFCLFIHQKNDHTFLNGTDSPAGPSADQPQAPLLHALWAYAFKWKPVHKYGEDLQCHLRDKAKQAADPSTTCRARNGSKRTESN